MSQNILIVEDEIKIAKLLADYMSDAGFGSSMLHRGDEVMPWLKNNKVDLILLDLMLPGIDGLDVCKQVRQRSNVPIIMVTAKVEEIDRLLGLEIGADDYICKPFSPREVVARVKAVLRRIGTQAVVVQDELILDEAGYQVVNGGRKTCLTAVEFRLFSKLYRHPGHIYTRNKLIESIYDDHRIVSDRTVDSHIKKLRSKLADIGVNETAIHSVYGVGYKYE